MLATDFFTFDWGAATDTGCVRKLNEDSLLSRPDCGLWSVADGMGGHAAGDVASNAIVAELGSVGVAASAEDQRARVLDRLFRANANIRKYAAQRGGTVGATVVALLTHDAEFSCIWAGDSRAYLLRGERLHQVTEDHTEVRALVAAGALSEAEAKAWPRRHVITRAIGVTPEPDCETVTGPLQPGDSVLLCSDGLTEHLSDDDIARFLRDGTAQEACDRLVQETLARGARDNVTVVVVRCLPPPPPAYDEDWADA